MDKPEPIRINPSNTIETRLWSEIYIANLQGSYAHGLSVNETKFAERSAAEAADRAVLALRERTSREAQA